MNAKEFLRGIKRLDVMINHKCEILAELRAQAESATVALNPDKVQSSGKMTYDDLLVKIVDLEYRINTDIDHFVEEKQKAMELIDSIDDELLVEILYRRYFKRQKWEVIAVGICKGYRHVIRLHGYALQELEKKMS